MENRQLTADYRVVVSGLAPQFSDIAPLLQTSMFSYFPDNVFVPPLDDDGNVIPRAPWRAIVVPRFARLAVTLEQDKLVGRVEAWWDERRLLADHKNTHKFYTEVMGLRSCHAAFANPVASLFNVDVPLYVDSTCDYSYDMTALVVDCMHALNGKIPFRTNGLADRILKKIADQVPFIDIKHFESVVDEDDLICLSRHLINQHYRYFQGLALLPARWFSGVTDLRDVFVDVSTPYVLPLANPSKATVKVGCLDFNLRTDTRRRQQQSA